MARIGRLIILGMLACGMLLTVALAFGGGKQSPAFGATGYGSDTIPPSQLATTVSTPSQGGVSGPVVVGVGVGTVIVIGTGGAIFWRKGHA